MRLVCLYKYLLLWSIHSRVLRFAMIHFFINLLMQGGVLIVSASKQDTLAYGMPYQHNICLNGSHKPGGLILPSSILPLNLYIAPPIQRNDDARVLTSGMLESLPFEMQEGLPNTLDLESTGNMRLLNSAYKAIVDNLPAYTCSRHALCYTCHGYGTTPYDQTAFLRVLSTTMSRLWRFWPVISLPRHVIVVAGIA